MSYAVALGQLLTAVIAGVYLLSVVVLTMTWALAYHDEDKHPWQLLAVLAWPALGLLKLLSWAFAPWKELL